MDFDETLFKSLLSLPDDEVCVVTFVSKARIDGVTTNLLSDSKFYYDAAKSTIYLSCELSVKALPFLHVSHILVFLANSSNLDVQYLQRFRQLDAARLKHKEQLNKKLGRSLQSHGRFCSPRALFILKDSPECSEEKATLAENQIYRTLRRSRVVTNNCMNSLFAVPTNRPFVHLGHEDCLPFIESHTSTALKSGFNDNVGRNAGKPAFQIPKLHRWVAIFEKMLSFYRNVSEIDIDAKFSEDRCAKAYPVALTAYKNKLPPFYDEFLHQAKMAYAAKVFRAKAKGPTVQKLLDELRIECDEYWRDGRESCKEKSLTGHGCGRAIHEAGEHVACVHFVAACNCGRTRVPRTDPFNLIEANFEFYETAECCADLECIDFASDDNSEADMTCTQTPTIAKFPSWSCVCVGPSSRYSHKSGITDQPGLISGSNFLLPWDVKLEFTREQLDSSGDTRKGTTRAVKVFIGLEYECPRGDRFMMSSPDTMLRSTTSGLVKESANKIVSLPMPLYSSCPCQMQGQLMRIHVVTPKLAVDVTVNPRVQPAPSAPVFYPMESLTLTQSAYWVIRLPYVYKNKGITYRPEDGKTDIESARLLGGLLTVAAGSSS